MTRNFTKLNDIARKYTLSSLISSRRISQHFFSFHIVSIQIHSVFLFNCSSSQMIDQARMMRIIGNKSSPQRS